MSSSGRPVCPQGGRTFTAVAQREALPDTRGRKVQDDQQRCASHSSISVYTLQLSGDDLTAPATDSAPQTHRRKPRAGKSTGTDYSSPTYWANRFENERAFEWLAGGDVICPLALQVVRGVRAALEEGKLSGGSRDEPRGGEREYGREQLRRVGAGDGDGDGDDAGPSRPSRSTQTHTRALRLLHFGSGTSSLGTQVQRYLQEMGEHVQVTDADYVADALAPSHTPAPSSDTDAEQWLSLIAAQRVPLINLDVLSPEQLLQHMPRSATSQLDTSSVSYEHEHEHETSPDEDGEGWDILLDKSTADAISCGPDIPLPTFPSSFTTDPLSHPSTHSGVSTDIDAPLVEPIIALCHNLARATRKGGRWLCISYSSTRFDHLADMSPGTGDVGDDGGAAQGGEPGWRLISKSPVDGFTDSSPSPIEDSKEGKGERVVYAPQVNVWAYVLERI